MSHILLKARDFVCEPLDHPDVLILHGVRLKGFPICVLVEHLCKASLHRTNESLVDHVSPFSKVSRFTTFSPSHLPDRCVSDSR